MKFFNCSVDWVMGIGDVDYNNIFLAVTFIIKKIKEDI